MITSRDYSEVLEAVRQLAAKQGVKDKPFVKPDFDPLCSSLWDGQEHWSVGRFRSLSHVNRFLTCKTKRSYTVDSHSYGVAMLCMIILDKIENDPIDSECEEPIIISPDFKLRVYERALLHDCDESISMDIHYFIKRDFEELVEKEIAANIHVLNLSRRLQEIAATPDGQADLAVRFVRIVDTMELALFCLEEELIGNVIQDSGYPVIDTCGKIIINHHIPALLKLRLRDHSTEFDRFICGFSAALRDLLYDFLKFIEHKRKEHAGQI